MFFIPINYLAVLVCAVVQMAIGAAWYSPALFGSAWMRLSGMTPDKIAAAKQKGMGMIYGMQAVLALLEVWILAHFIFLADAHSIATGATIGFLAWLGFVATVSAGAILFEKKSIKLFLLQSGYQLICLVITGAILAVWRA
ncbi:MAG: DUF1761 domain-containing protein [Patescibacteria group bacterium]